MYDIITVGSATVDVFAKTEAEEIAIKKTGQAEEDLIAYPTGAKILIKQLDFKIGGGGTNTAVAFSRLGLKTAFLGQLGDDDNSRKVLEMLKREKIAFVGKKSREQTGYSIILDSMADDRTILTNKGANNSLDYSRLDLSKLKTRWFYFSSMMGNSLKTLENLADFAAKNSIKIAFNPSSYLIKENPSSVMRILNKTNVLVCNKEEAEMLFGRIEMKELLMKSITVGPKISIITDGKNGCTLCEKKGKDFIFYSLRPRKVKIVETTGAGDAFASSFVSGYIKKKGDIKFSLRLGMTNAESVIQHIGAKEILLTYNAALRSMERERHKITVEKV